MAEIANSLANDSDVWFGVATRREQLSDGRRGGAEDCVEIPGFWSDVDIAGPGHSNGANLPLTWDEAMAILAKLPLPPTVTVGTGGGMHAYWLFYEPLR
jgi:hypothetical protein